MSRTSSPAGSRFVAQGLLKVVPKLCVLAFIVVVCAMPAGQALAQSAKGLETRPQDAAGWLNLMSTAATQAVYSGIYIHQYGGRMETSRITHIADESGEHEKLETLDGPPREIIRRNDEIICYMPDAKVIKLDRKRARKFFPGLLSNISNVTENYSAKLGEIDRVAGFDCQVVVLDPKDSYRFGHRFCAELNSGLMLRATMISDRTDVLEHFVFTQVGIGSPINRDLLKPSYADKKTGWQTDRSALQEASGPDSGWYVKSLPAGFKKIVEVKRAMSGRADPVIQQIYSDGLASVSVFIETSQPGDSQRLGLVQQGGYTFYVRSIEDQPFSIKVLGEVPRNSLQQIGNSLVSRQR
ncbi:MAG TPA: MucB/RseB C-terminal domain-containing protein [Burkholderiales bacterium]|nr:MucB/RseB C-terminal domain-containing protein [Burkholderiales bacterium]